MTTVVVLKTAVVVLKTTVVVLKTAVVVLKTSRRARPILEATTPEIQAAIRVRLAEIPIHLRILRFSQ